MRADESLADNGQYFIINAPQRKGEIKGTGKVSSGILSVRNTECFLKRLSNWSDFIVARLLHKQTQQFLKQIY